MSVLGRVKFQMAWLCKFVLCDILILVIMFGIVEIGSPIVFFYVVIFIGKVMVWYNRVFVDRVGDDDVIGLVFSSIMWQ